MTLPVVYTKYMDNPSKNIAKKAKKSNGKGKGKYDAAVPAPSKSEPRTFHLFPELPAELKVMIWKESFKVCWKHNFAAFEMGTMRRNKVKYLIRQGGLGAVLYVNSLSRKTVLEEWKKWVNESHEGVGTPCSVGLVLMVAWLADGKKLVGNWRF